MQRGDSKERGNDDLDAEGRPGSDAALEGLWYSLEMQRKLVRFAAALLLLALPMQAFAAASMLFCGRVTHNTWLQQTARALSDHDADHHATVLHGNDSGHHGRAVGHNHDGDHGQLKHLAESCSACSDCCCPTALPSAQPPSTGLIGSLVLIVSSAAQPIPDASPDRLERPPSNTLV